MRAAFAPVAELFAPLKPMFDWLGGKLKAVWDWFNNLIAPVKSSQETLNSFRDAGVLFGKRLADALTLPLTAFNKLRSGIDWVLEKLGIINKESSTLDQTAAKRTQPRRVTLIFRQPALTVAIRHINPSPHRRDVLI